MIGLRYLAMWVALIVVTAAVATAQEVPAGYRAVLSALGKTGDCKDGVLKVNIPRNHLRVTIDQRPAPTPFGFGGWVALTKGPGMDVMMGDLVLTKDEVNIDLREHGAPINARMRLNTWAAFAGTDADAMVAGDVAMLDLEVTPVLKNLSPPSAS